MINITFKNTHCGIVPLINNEILSVKYLLDLNFSKEQIKNIAERYECFIFLDTIKCLPKTFLFKNDNNLELFREEIEKLIISSKLIYY